MSSFLGFLVKRTLLFIPLSLALAVFIFFIMEILPAFPKPSNNLFEWLHNLFRGDLGHSTYYTGRPVTEMTISSIGPTLKLTGLSLLMTLTVGIVGGVVCAYKQHSYTDRVISVLTVSGMAVPDMLLGLLLILLFSVVLGWFPVAGYSTFGESGFGSLKYLILPALALSFGQIALLTRMVRARMLDVLSQEYIIAAKAMGFTESTVLRYAFKNTMVSVLTVMGMIMATLIGGSVIIENIFAIPGVGRLLVLSIFRRDYKVVQGAILLVAFTYLFVNFVVDILYAIVDPRITYASEKK